MNLTLEIAGKLPEGVRKKTLADAIKTVAAVIDRPGPDGIINLKLVDDAEIQALNKKYGDSDKPTDVLSFNYTDDGSEPLDGELGDIAISFETATRQALEVDTPLETEVALLLIHGCLHLLGYDHQDQDELTQMDGLQTTVMTRLGLTYRNFKWDLSTV